MFKKKNLILVFSVIIVTSAVLFYLLGSNVFKKSESKKAPTNKETTLKKSTSNSSDKAVSTAASTNKMDIALYEVKKGDTLYGISRQYKLPCPEHIAVNAIRKLNGLSANDIITEKMTLKIPLAYLKSGVTHIIEKGDTLSNIAKKFMGTTNAKDAISKIKSDNSLDSNKITIGDELYITTANLK